MADPKGFLKLARQDTQYRNISKRKKDFKDVFNKRSLSKAREQASRCMDCGTPFCHWACPLGNYIPELNDYIFKGNWNEAVKLLESANSMPEITAKVCPALCEYGCVLSLNSDAVTIKENEFSIVETGFNKGLIKPRKIKNRTGKKVAVIGSGPAGLTAGSILNRLGHTVTVFERDRKIGGILRYGIPDFKLEKQIIDRRLNLWKEEGLILKSGINVGVDYKTEKLLSEFDAICLSAGSRVPRDLNIEGRKLKGICFAMDYLTQSNKRVSKEKISGTDIFDAKNKKVLIIGGGDTGANCVGVAHRQGALSVTQIELLPKPPSCRSENEPWPEYPMLLKTTSSHEEGGKRLWSVLTKSFKGQNGIVKNVCCVKTKFSNSPKGASSIIKEIPGSEFEIKADLVILAIGFIGTEKNSLIKKLNIELTRFGNVKTDYNYSTSFKGIFSAGDMRRGQSLVAWAIAEGKQAAFNIDKYLCN